LKNRKNIIETLLQIKQKLQALPSHKSKAKKLRILGETLKHINQYNQSDKICNLLMQDRLTDYNESLRETGVLK